MSGVFDINSKVSIRDIKDGTSNTFALGEAASGFDIARGMEATDPFTGGVGSAHGWAIGGYSAEPQFSAGWVFAGSLSSTVERINKTPVTDSFMDIPQMQNNTPSFQGGPHRVSNFRSFHPGGAFFLRADGSVVFISEAIQSDVYRALSTIQGGEAVSAGKF